MEQLYFAVALALALSWFPGTQWRCRFFMF